MENSLLAVGLSQQQKVGAFVTVFGLGFFILGIVLFFDRGILGIGNLGILIGITIGLGLSRTFYLFKRAGLFSSTGFFAGVILVLSGRVFTGLIFELIGGFNCFRNIFPIAISVGRYVPIISSILEFPGIYWLANKLSPELKALDAF